MTAFACMPAIRVSRPTPVNGPSHPYPNLGVLMAAPIRIHGLHAHRRGSDVRAAGSVLPAIHGLHAHRCTQ